MNDDPTRELAVARSDDETLVHLAIVGDTDTVLLSGEQTDGRFAMLDMLFPRAAGLRRTELSGVERRNRLARAATKAPEYGIEMLAPGRASRARPDDIERAETRAPRATADLAGFLPARRAMSQ